MVHLSPILAMRGGRGNRNTFHLPVTVSLDPRITKNVPLIEGVRLQFLAEGFNLLNRGNIVAVRTTQFALSDLSPVYGIVSTPCLVPQFAGPNTFATPTATSGPRILQLALKFDF